MSIYSNKTLPAAVVASASYDGDIYIWSLETGSVLSKLNRIESFSTQTTNRHVMPRISKNVPQNNTGRKTAGGVPKSGRETATSKLVTADSNGRGTVTKQTPAV